MKNYTEEEVLLKLKRKSDLRVDGRQIHQLKQGKGDVGNKTKGMIDFLIKYCGYVHMYVDKFKIK